MSSLCICGYWFVTLFLSFSLLKKTKKKVYLSFPVGVYTNRTRAYAYVIVAQNLYLFVYTHGYGYWKIRTYWSIHFYDYNAKAYVQFNICIVEHIIYLFPHLVKSHKVLGDMEYGILNRIWFSRGYNGFPSKRIISNQHGWFLLSSFYVHILNGLRFFDANGFTVSLHALFIFIRLTRTIYYHFVSFLIFALSLFVVNVWFMPEKSFPRFFFFVPEIVHFHRLTLLLESSFREEREKYIFHKFPVDITQRANWKNTQYYCISFFSHSLRTRVAHQKASRRTQCRCQLFKHFNNIIASNAKKIHSNLI